MADARGSTKYELYCIFLAHLRFPTYEMAMVAAERVCSPPVDPQHTIDVSPRLPTSLPITLLSGFLYGELTTGKGSGKTTLLQHILKSNHGLRIAVIVNDIGTQVALHYSRMAVAAADRLRINVDASLIKHTVTRTKETIIALENGCICCTLRGDLLQELVRLAELAEFDYVIIESSGISEPGQVAETFDSRLAEQMLAQGAVPDGLDDAAVDILRHIRTAGGVEKFARLDTTCTVIDAFTILQDFETADYLSARRNDVVPEDERTISDLMVDQIEFADVIIINKADMVKDTVRRSIRSLISKLNHRAKVLECSYGRVDVKAILNTGTFNLEQAQACSLRSPHVTATNK
ncbi:hypothetical protein LTS10_011270 [Elasticomyces elasticus]|nr:hypothetical protein LTS10_011270 [Elasticomyces elasticus]